MNPETMCAASAIFSLERIEAVETESLREGVGLGCSKSSAVHLTLAFISTGLNLAILDGHLAVFPEPINFVFGGALILTSLFSTAGPIVRWSRSSRSWLFTVLMVGLAGGCLLSPFPSTRLFAPGLGLAAAWVLRSGSVMPAHPLLLGGAGLYALGGVGFDVVPGAWSIIMGITTKVTQGLTRLVGGEVGLSLSALPIGTAMFVGLVWGLSGGASRHVFWKSGVRIAGCCLLLLLAQIEIMGALAERATAPVSTIWTLTLILNTVSSLAMLAMTAWHLNPIETTMPDSLFLRGIVYASALALIIVLVATRFTEEELPHAGEILVVAAPPFLDPMHEYRATSTDPVALHEGGLFGDLPGTLRAMGFRTIVKEGLPTSDQLAHTRLVILTVPNPTWAGDRAAWTSLQQFVLRGGSLLVLAEHTNFQMSSSVLNPLLAPFGISVNFDTTQAGFGEDLRSVRVWPSSYQAVFDGSLAFPYNRGASLSVVFPARPILTGRWWQGDAGNAFADDLAFLGDYRFGPRDRLGDQVLAAEWAGAAGGRIVVFGDTTPFINTALGYTHTALGQLVRVLMTHAQSPAWLPGLMAGVALAGLFLLLGQYRATWLLPGALVSTAMVTLFLGLADRHHNSIPRLPERAFVVLGNFLNKLDLSIYGEWAPTALMIEARRQGFNPLVEQLDQIQASRPAVAVVPAPRRPLSSAELRQLREWVQEGSTLFITLAGDAAPAVAFGQQFGLTIGLNPLGRISVQLFDDLTVQFHCAWPLELGSDWTPIIEYRGLPIVAQQTMGRGRIIVIGDEGMAVNLALATETTVFPSNLRWWGTLLWESRGRK